MSPTGGTRTRNNRRAYRQISIQGAAPTRWLCPELFFRICLRVTKKVVSLQTEPGFIKSFSKNVSNDLAVPNSFRIFATELQQSVYEEKKKEDMTTIQLNAEIYRAMGVIAEDEGLLKRALKYLKKLAAQKQDETLMTKEEFYAKLERGEEAYRQGKCHSILPDEDLTSFLRRRGYDL